MQQGCSLAPPAPRVAEEAGVAEVVAVPPVEVAGVEDLGKVAPQGTVSPTRTPVASITLPRQLVEEEETVPVEGQRAGLVLVLGLAMELVAVLARHLPLPAVGMLVLMVRVQAVVEVVVPKGPAGLVPEVALAKDLARVA